MTKWPQNLKFKKGDQSDTWISEILHFSPDNFFFKFSLTFVGKIQKSRLFLKSSLLAVYRRPLKWF